jgi:hypothetical protein
MNSERNWGDLACAIVSFKVHELVKWLQLFVVMVYESPVEPITNQNLICHFTNDIMISLYTSIHISVLFCGGSDCSDVNVFNLLCIH